MRAILLTLLLLTTAPAYAQIPSAQGQLPGTLTPAPPVIPPPPLAIPAPVPPASGGPPSVFQGTARSSPGYYYNPPLSGSVRTIYRGKKIDRPPKKKRGKKHRRPRVSESEIIWRVA
jgi:hypothetical protein